MPGCIRTAGRAHDHGRQHPRLLAANFLGRADADHGVRRTARLAAQHRARYDGRLFGVQWSFLTLDGLRHLLLPALNLSLFNISLVLRLTRAGVRETLPMDYIKFARAKGLSPARVIFVHVLKNIMIPVVTVIGLELGSTIAFAVVTESVFAWPGMGKLIIDSINVLDRPVIVAYLMMIVLLFVTINLVVDVLYTVLDPRVRLETKG